ncbi:hypothetical protein ACMATS_09360 [Streptoverticillium reticulum]|uniref:hypothetical protein n=1 Tax=Streptoverticillium reticulum TaxID=1433415 RepID=UPI0039BFDEE1
MPNADDRRRLSSLGRTTAFRMPDRGLSCTTGDSTATQQNAGATQQQRSSDQEEQ